jgi:thymidylate synthase
MNELFSNEKQYLDALSLIQKEGIFEADRTKTGTYRYPGLTMKFDMSKGFPLLTTKKILFYPMIVELLWFLQGRNDLKWLQERNCNIWNSWHLEDGTIGRGYGVQYRSWAKGVIHKVDQIKEAISTLKTDPSSRRIIVSAWNPGELDQMALPPCHAFYQFIAIDKTLHIVLHQRSADFFLGIPWNIASYSVLLHLVAREVGMKAGTLTHNIGDAHIYSNHMDQVKEQLSRVPFAPPKLIVNDKLFPESLGQNNERGLLWWIDNKASNVTLDDIKSLIKVEDYNCHSFIKAPVAV